jgi:hypothetical protein
LARRFEQLRKNSILHLILGGAALQRCDNWLIFNTGFTRCGEDGGPENTPSAPL